MASFTKCNCFVEHLAEKKHNLGSDVLTLALTNDAPVVTDTVLVNLIEIVYTYCSTRVPTIVSSAQTSGTYKLVLQDLTLTASGGEVGPFRYIVLYNSTATNDELIGWWDRGASITLLDTETLPLDFDGTNGAITLA